VSAHGAILGLVTSPMPHPLLVPQQSEGIARLRRAWDAAREEVHTSGADLLLVYSTLWQSIIGHQVQADPAPEWVHVDELFHDLGSIPYRFRVDAAFAEAYRDAALRRGLAARTVAYRGFPIDTGSIVALRLLDPENAIPACIVSSNRYADRAETIVLGKAAQDALRGGRRRAVVVAVTSLSNRMFTDFVAPAEDRIHSLKDDEWNRKILEFLGEGRLEDVSQLSREIHRQIRVKKVVNFKPMWWLAAVMGQHNNYIGKVHGYAPVQGTGACVVSLRPAPSGVGDKEFDEEDVEVFAGDRNVLRRAEGAGGRASTTPPAAVVRSERAPRPVGPYPHARRVGDLLYLSGIGPRAPGTDVIPGGPVRDARGAPLDYDVAAQTRATIENVRAILEDAGSSLADVVDVTAFLTDMDRDFARYNEVYREYFGATQPTRTTVGVSSLPTPIAVELKVIARPGSTPEEGGAQS
jgi:2-aminomuconate deaminase